MNRLRRQDSIADNLRAAPLRARRAAQSVFARPHPAPIFILGHQKSGTSAVAGLLGELTGEAVTIDLRNEDRWPTYAKVAGGEVSFERLVRRNRLDFSRPIVKEPNLTFFYPQLVARFPAARFAMVVRDPRDNVKSVLERFGLPGNGERLGSEQLQQLRYGWRLMLEPGWLGLEGGSYVDVLAQRWSRCADVYLRQPGAMALLRYEDFRADKLGTLEALAAALGLEPRNDISAQLERQFQPPGDRSRSAAEFLGPDNLERVERRCGSRMERLGYGAFVSL